ncbi:hypothetical protein A3A71_03855 [Candidatus Berkelbacteria bacterium RIFCSPLOWO2_01_FULL_50_28]|uniref:Uncharacterized protein n=1 Tax=Candidatus Berkelbacteria bacterium RIFCSPLOWO2_01_FULL_50_28 TaxID=1797471 RepID=A0A1F5EA60_9BACT|nr:MAG: hypothetical protein A3F39_01220 [Candidatus Berkelbacteria bacterium RIFCSPHIGHO2_12_FULL_50_11]OGD64282.1 MAG: hypothetical protein A3A71_03855 [Candidatus Berkelbacteria bacterium RIFCSPLOWO2_01_FULL_50_28]
MSKKNKKKFQAQLAKKIQLQQINQGSVVSFAEPSAAIVTAPQTETAIVESHDDVSIKTPAVTGLKRTMFCVAIIAVLFIGAVITKRTTPYDTQLGNWVYETLRLSN